MFKKKNTIFKYSFIKVLTGSDLSRRRLPLMQAFNKTDSESPVIWITACSHGDEVSGLAVVQEIFKYLKKNDLLKGRLNSFPLMNPIGFENVSRSISLTEEDLNRCFPGNSYGSTAERMADLIYSNISNTHPDLLIDIHNDWQKSIPYILLDKSTEEISKDVYKTTLDIAKKCGFIIIQDNETIKNSLSYNLLKNNIPSLTLELGESLVVNENNIYMGTRSLLQILLEYGMIEKNFEYFNYKIPDKLNKRVFNYYDKPYCSTSGLIRFMVKPGDFIKKGQVTAKIFNAFGKLQEKITAHYDGIILGHRDSSVAFPGLKIFAYGIL